MPQAIDKTSDAARRIRAKVIEMSHKARTPHLGSSLSCIDILTVLYWDILNHSAEDPWSPSRDRFILSKGHAATALYATLALRNFFSAKELELYNTNGANLAEHPGAKSLPGIEAATGSLGHGLPIGLGIALASRIHQTPYHTYVLMSDGECNEGSVWEAAMMAPTHKLDKLTVIIDYNKWQATDRSQDVLQLDPLHEKWKAFGWEAHEVNGHNHDELRTALAAKQKGPKAIVAHTTKGKGVSFMEDDNNWHYRIPNEEEVLKAKEELGVL